MPGKSAVLPFSLFPLVALAAHAGQPFALRVIDADTKRPVPLIRVSTVSQVADYTDNAGLVTFDEPDLVGRETWFNISGDGYEAKADGFGIRGIRAVLKPGETKTVEVRRLLPAERIRRLTGGGRTVHQDRLNPGKTPPLPGEVLGCDTVDAAIFGGRMFWLWGDTNRPSYPLGNFDTTLATTPLPGTPGCIGADSIDYAFFTQADGFVKKAAPIPGSGPTWLGALATLKDRGGKEHLVATYAKIRNSLDVYERGLCEFDTKEQIFKKVLELPLSRTLFPDGHAFLHEGSIYFGQATPTLKMPATYESWLDPAKWQPVTCDIAFTDATTGKPVKAHNGSIAWNPWRKRWTSIFTEKDGTSALGEIRYAEAPAPEGPWRKSVKIITHAHYTFYNPLQHPGLAEDGGRVVWLEGTYTATFSGNPNLTPRHDYNQVLYRLDLADPRLEVITQTP